METSAGTLPSYVTQSVHQDLGGCWVTQFVLIMHIPEGDQLDKTSNEDPAEVPKLLHWSGLKSNRYGLVCELRPLDIEYCSEIERT
jgi:hypothetical protein